MAKLTRMNKMIKCRSCGKLTHSSIGGCVGIALCRTCLDDAEMENEHNDSHGDDHMDLNCPYYNPQGDPNMNKPKKADISNAKGRKRAADQKEIDAIFANDDAPLITLEPKVRKTRSDAGKPRVPKSLDLKPGIDKATVSEKLRQHEAVTIIRQAAQADDPEKYIAELREKYPHVIPGTLQKETSGKWEGKFTVEINTVDEKNRPDGKTLRCATSDLFQVRHQPEVLATMRRVRAKMRKVHRND